jgi:hypothetical protein
MKEKKLLKMQSLPKVLRSQAMRSLETETVDVHVPLTGCVLMRPESHTKQGFYLFGNSKWLPGLRFLEIVAA